MYYMHAICANNVIFTFVVVSFFVGEGFGVCEMDKIHPKLSKGSVEIMFANHWAIVTF